MTTLLLTRSDVVRHLDALYLLADLREAFRKDSLARSVAPQRAWAPVHAEGGALAVFPGAIPGVPAYTVRVRARFPGHAADASEVVHLHDLASGALLAVMDAGQLGRVRTAVLAALAADVLARPDASRVALVGAGALAPVLLKCLRLVRTLSHVRVYDPSPAASLALSTRMYAALSLPAHPAASVAEAVEDADIVLAATESRVPFLFPEMVRPGTHVTTLGANEPGRLEVDARLLQAARVVCDHRGLALSQGAVGNAGLGADAIHAELGEVVAGLKPGRTHAEELSVFAGVGLPMADLAAAWQVYQLAGEDAQVQRLDFGA